MKRTEHTKRNKIVLLLLAVFIIGFCSTAYWHYSRKPSYEFSLNKKAVREQPVETIPQTLPLDTLLLPRSTTGNKIWHNYYVLSYVEKSEQAEWVFYALTQDMLSVKKQKRSNNFRSDPLVDTGSSNPSDYKNSGYDKGHLVPAADMAFSKVSMSESFYMSNMAPQQPSFNRGIWSRLENRVRQWAYRMGIVYVISGGILGHTETHIGQNAVEVPRFFYKIVYSPEKGQMLGFIMPNKKAEKPLFAYACTVDSIEKLTKIDFFFRMDKKLQSARESVIDTMAWKY